MDSSAKPDSKTNESAFFSGNGEMDEHIRNFNWAKTPLGSPEHWPQSLKNCVQNLLSSTTKAEHQQKQASETSLHNLVAQSPVAMTVLKGSKHIIEIANKNALELWGKTHEEVIDLPALQAMPELDEQGFGKILDDVFATGKPFIANEFPVTLTRHKKPQTVYINFIYEPLRNSNGSIDGIVGIAIDVSEQVINRKKIEESEDQLRIALEAGELGTYDFNPQTGQLKWSAKTKELFGLPPEVEVNYDTFLQGLHPDDKDRSHAAIQKALDPKIGGIYENEYRTIGITDNRLRWIKSKGKISFNTDGKPLRFTGVVQEITKQKEILASLQLQSLVFDRMDEGVSVSDENGIILLTNAAENKIFGYDTGELVGKHLTLQNAYTPDENEKIVNNVITELKQKGFWNGEWHNRKKDGTDFYTHSFITTLNENGKTLFVCVQRDITEEKADKVKLAYRAALLEAQNEAIPDAILIVDTKGKMISFNQHFVELWQIPQDIIERKDDDAALQFAMTQLKDPQGFIEVVNESYQHPEKKVHGEILFKDGRIIERYGNAVLGEDGTMYGWAWYFRDITEQKISDHALKENEERFRSLANSIPQLAWMTDAEGGIYWYNQRWFDYTGTTLEEMKGWGWQSVHHPDLVEKVKRDFTQAIAKGEPYDDTFLLRSKEGDYRWFLTRAVPIRNVDGQVVQWFGTNTDVSEQRETEEALKRTKEQLELTFKNTPAAIYLFGKKGEILFVNLNAAQLMGYATAEELLAEKDYAVLKKRATDTFDVFSEFRKPFPLDKAPTAIAFQTGKPAEAIILIVRKSDNKEIWVLTKSSPLFDDKGELTTVLTTSTDITVQKTAEEKIRQSEHQLRSLSEQLELKVKERTEELISLNKTLLIQNETFKQAEESSGQGSYSFNLTTGILAYSDNLYKLLGYAPGEFAPSLDEFNKHVHPEDRELVKNAAEKVVETVQADVWNYRMAKKDGSIIYIRGTGRIITSTIEKLLVGTLQDITADVLLKQTLQIKNLELERSNEDLQQFAHVASHDLKEPIRKVRTFGSRLEEEFKNELPEKAKIYLRKMQNAAERMYGLIDGVLDYSTLNSLDGVMELVNLNKICYDIENDLEVVLQQEQGQLRIDPLPQINGSPVLLNQLFYNLINNSLKFSKAGEPPVISIRSKNVAGKEIKKFVAVDEKKEFVQISICDNGIGFNQEHADNIFKTFTRLNSRDKYEGTGLGLALCKKIAERHNGYIYATAKENEGACFNVLFPV